MPQCLLTVLNERAMNLDERVSISYRQVGVNVELMLDTCLALNSSWLIE